MSVAAFRWNYDEEDGGPGGTDGSGCPDRFDGIALPDPPRDQQQGLAAHGALGVARSLPTWLPRNFLPPGRRLKVHPDDLYAFGMENGGTHHEVMWIGDHIDRLEKLCNILDVEFVAV